jgi:hypothetical protein
VLVDAEPFGQLRLEQRCALAEPGEQPQLRRREL